MRYRLRFQRNKRLRNIVAENYQDLKGLFSKLTFDKAVLDKEIQIQGKANTRWRTCCDGRIGCRICIPILDSSENSSKMEMILGLCEIGDEIKFAIHEQKEAS